jgi:hypothetical protein
MNYPTRKQPNQPYGTERISPGVVVLWIRSDEGFTAAGIITGSSKSNTLRLHTGDRVIRGKNLAELAEEVCHE